MAEFQSESDLKSREKNDGFWITRIFKFAVLAIGVLGLIFIAVLFFTEILVNPEFKRAVLDTILRDLATILIAGGSILGITAVASK